MLVRINIYLNKKANSFVQSFLLYTLYLVSVESFTSKILTSVSSFTVKKLQQIVKVGSKNV